MRARHVGFQDQNRAGIGVVLESTSSLVAFWRPNPSDLSLLVSVRDARKLLINFAWGARGPGFKSRRPDQCFQKLTDLTPPTNLISGPNLGPKQVRGRGVVVFVTTPFAT